MAGFITMAQALSAVVGGVPVQPAGAMTIVEKLRAAKSMLPGNIGGILNKVLSEGPGAILQNPMAAVQGLMGGNLGQMIGTLQGVVNGNFSGVLNAVMGATGLQSVLGQFSQVTNLLSGLQMPGLGQFGLLDALGHANITQMFGSMLPAGLSIETVMGPITMAADLAGMAARIPAITQGLVNGSLSPLSAIASIERMSMELRGAMDASDFAFSTIHAQVEGIAQTAALISMVASGPAGLGEIANLVIQDVHKAEIQAAMDEQIREAEIASVGEDET